MKKAFAVLLCLVMLVACLPVSAFAAETWGDITVEASNYEPQAGETVTFTVYLDDCSKMDGAVKNYEFSLDIQGMTYVKGSGVIDPKFSETTGFVSPLFNEDPNFMKSSSLGFLGTGAVGYTGGKVAIMSFQCVMGSSDAVVGVKNAKLTYNRESRIPTVTSATLELHEHSFSWVIDKDASEFETGSKHEECSCGATRNEGTTIPATHEHNYNIKNSDSNNHWDECKCGDKINVTAHSWSWVVDKEASEFEAGSKHEECACGETRSEGTTIPATHKHSYSDTFESDNNYHWKECACGDSISDKAAHTWTWIEDKAATEFDPGSKHEECTICGLTRNEDTEIPATHVHTYVTWKTDGKNHWKECECGVADMESFGSCEFDWVVDTEAGEFTEGEKHEECGICGGTKNEGTVIPQTHEHKWEWVVDKEATVDEEGSKHEECSCGEKRNESTAIEKLQPENPVTPPTGDTNMIVLYAILVLATVAGVVLVLKKKENYNA